MRTLIRILGLIAVLAAACPASVAAAAFDLPGPSLEVTVTHAGKSLPITRTPNLTAGDQLVIKPMMPAGQSAQYVLIAAFLRGATNPPPKEWFYRYDSWNAGAGLKLTVPLGAEQALVFLAPKTGGDFRTLVSAVRGRPGAFVRASQDLNQASLDRSRLDTFLGAIRKSNQVDPNDLKTVSPLLARSLAIKIDGACLLKSVDLQAPCLMQSQDSIVLDDGHGASIVQTLTSGDTANLVNEISASPQAGYGYHTPYIAAVFDIFRIIDGFHTAQYQYIPALSVARGDRLQLVVNTAPSFHKPMSVLVAALPGIGPAEAPAIRPADAKDAYCVQKPDLVLQATGAPLVFSTGYARDLVLRMSGKDGQSVDLPVRPDPQRGGFAVDASRLDAARLGDAQDGLLRGYWGFEPFEGPRFRVQHATSGAWKLAPDDTEALIVGRDDTVRLQGPSAACVQSVTFKRGDETVTASLKVNEPDEVALTLPLSGAQAGPVTLQITQYGSAPPQSLAARAFEQPGRLDRFAIYAGDGTGLLKGARLDEVASLTLKGIAFTPAQLTSVGRKDELSFLAADQDAAARLKPGESAIARVVLKDGRKSSLKVTVEPPRPVVALLSRTVDNDPRPGAAASRPATASRIQLTGPDQVAQGGTVTFSLRAQRPTALTGEEKVEISTVGDSQVRATLTSSAGLMLQDNHVAVATLDTAKAFNASVFGPLQFRIVVDGAPGQWQPLATLVRLPVLREVKCAPGRPEPCEVAGDNLFLIAAVSADARFDRPVEVPEGFTGSALRVPRPVGGRLYVKLHDNPGAVTPVVVAGG